MLPLSGFPRKRALRCATLAIAVAFLGHAPPTSSLVGVSAFDSSRRQIEIKSSGESSLLESKREIIDITATPENKPQKGTSSAPKNLNAGSVKSDDAPTAIPPAAGSNSTEAAIAAVTDMMQANPAEAKNCGLAGGKKAEWTKDHHFFDEPFLL